MWGEAGPCADGCDWSTWPTCQRCGRQQRARSRPGVLRIGFWNKWSWIGPEKTLRILRERPAGWDAMLLVECTTRDVAALEAEYGAENVASVFDHDVDTERKKPHGPTVVVRHGLRISEHRPTFAWSDDPIEPKGDKGLTVEVIAPFGQCTVLATHVMNGGDGEQGWERKLRTYERLDDVLGPGDTVWPVIVGMDGNVWEDHLQDRPPVDRPSHPQAWFHSDWASHGLQDTLRTAILSDPDRTERARPRLEAYDGIVGTYQQSHTITRMDRLYASPDLQVLDAGVDATALDASDHALIWTDLLFPATMRTTDPDVAPKGPRASRSRPVREPELDEVVHAVLRSDRYGWNRRGYLARVALASAAELGYADKAFIDAHYPDDDQPHLQWSGARTTANRSWKTIGQGRFGDELVTYTSSTRRHHMDPDVARVFLSQLGIEDLLDCIADPDLETILRNRLTSSG